MHDVTEIHSHFGDTTKNLNMEEAHFEEWRLLE
jgi:hypothetical protein